MSRSAIILCTLISLLLALPATAGTLADVTFPETTEVDGHALRLNGLGLRTKLFIKVYVGALYLETTSKDAGQVINSDQAKQVILHFIYDGVSKEKLTDAWDEGFKKNAPGQMSALRGRLDKLNGWMEEVSSGDRIVMTWIPGKGTTVSVRGQEKGTIEGADFASALFSVWFGKYPPNDGLKEGMLGL